MIDLYTLIRLTGRILVLQECMPKMMSLVTLAEPIGPRQHAPSSGSVMVLPRLGKGWLVSRFSNTPATGAERAGKARLAGDVKHDAFVQPVRYANQNDCVNWCVIWWITHVVGFKLCERISSLRSEDRREVSALLAWRSSHSYVLKIPDYYS